MSHRSQELAERFLTLNRMLIAFVEQCPEHKWRKVCPGENWPVGVVARHVAADHYGALEIAKQVVAGQHLPELSMDARNRINADHAQQHSACTKDEVLALLCINGHAIAHFLAYLNDTDLDRTGQLALTEGAFSIRHYFQALIIGSSQEHLTSMMAAVAT